MQHPASSRPRGRPRKSQPPEPQAPAAKLTPEQINERALAALAEDLRPIAEAALAAVVEDPRPERQRPSALQRLRLAGREDVARALYQAAIDAAGGVVTRAAQALGLGEATGWRELRALRLDGWVAAAHRGRQGERRDLR